MSLKRRNIFAWILLLVCAVCWTFGQEMITDAGNSNTYETTRPGATEDAEATTYPPEASTIAATMPPDDWTSPGQEDNSMPEPTGSNPKPEEPDHRGALLIGFLLCLIALGTGFVAVFVFSQNAPVAGPDGISLIAALLGTASHLLREMEMMVWIPTVGVLTVYSRVLVAFLVPFSIRELLGWMRAKCALSWCLVHRMAKRCPLPQMSLLVFVGWIILALTGMACCLTQSAIYLWNYLAAFGGFVITAFWGVCCLWKYGADLNHFQKQLDNYQHGKPITVGDGAFSQTEAQLLDVQAQHEKAVRTAVTSERFKVELISNVSHDLRTPLTAILGYSELLQKENLSPEGQEQLRRLNQKAGYMRDLVESLFELTKVSSGVTESKKDEIDLIRLLEQTIGLFDDQLNTAGLVVRRHYADHSMIVVTDGARMHQVFANLLTNAIKYALPGTRIHLEVAETDESYRIRMVNTASYEMDFQPEEIVQRFARGDKARSTKGSGLGLAIAQTYTESVGGSFRVAIDGDQFSAIVELPKL